MSPPYISIYIGVCGLRISIIYEGSIEMDSKPHAVCIPYPAQSHIKAMLKLAKLLHTKGIHITFINTEYNQNRFLSSGGPDTLAGLPDFRFQAIPDGLPTTETDGTQDLAALCEATRTNFLAPFMDIIAKLNCCAGPPVTCIISDGFMGFTLDAGQLLAIPVAFFWTLASCGFLGFYQVPQLIQKGLIPLKDESCLTNDLLNRIVDWVPDKNLIRFKDLPSFIRTTNPEEVVFKFTSEAAQSSARTSANILHTFEELEPSVTSFLSSILPQLYTVGPLELLLNNISAQSLIKSSGYSLWKEDPRCTEWLNCKNTNSVVYVNFGSIAIMSPEKMAEFAWGLANSEHKFLWVIRPDLIEGKSGVLPTKFFEIIKEKGFIASWCQQEEVLNHSSIGGFLTHGGWNSTIESLSAGVPMICLPFFGDQMTNCRYICTEWEVGMELDSEFDRKDVERVVRELMEGEKGRKLRNKAIEWKEIAIKASGENGSSSLSLDKFVNKFFCQ